MTTDIIIDSAASVLVVVAVLVALAYGVADWANVIDSPVVAGWANE